MLQRNTKYQFYCGRCNMKTVPGNWMCWNARVATVRCGFSPPFIRPTPLDAFWNVLGCLLAPHLLHAPHLNSPSRELLQSTPRRTIREMCVLETPTNIPQRGLRLEFFALCPVCLAGP